ncbi:MAG: hypothetical protein L0287_16560, partial [Anaerolineae bacterium]|nr:hypothetical protein [Anaerolineae bacterium]
MLLQSAGFSRGQIIACEKRDQFFSVCAIHNQGLTFQNYIFPRFRNRSLNALIFTLAALICDLTVVGLEPKILATSS